MTVVKAIEVSADSKEGFDAAIRDGVGKVAERIENNDRVWFKDQTAWIQNGKVDIHLVHTDVAFGVQ